MNNVMLYLRSEGANAKKIHGFMVETKAFERDSDEFVQALKDGWATSAALAHDPKFLDKSIKEAKAKLKDAKGAEEAALSDFQSAKEKSDKLKNKADDALAKAEAAAKEAQIALNETGKAERDSKAAIADREEIEASLKGFEVLKERMK